VDAVELMVQLSDSNEMDVAKSGENWFLMSIGTDSSVQGQACFVSIASR